MAKLGLLLLITVCRACATNEDCGCDGKCSDPLLDWKTDCPSYGFDCQRTHAALTLFKKHAHRDHVALKCADSKAMLFVQGKRVKKLTCRKSSGKWTRNDECGYIDSALCALPCSTCSTRVPSFLSIDATSVSVLPASEGRPCSIGFCIGDGLTLSGIDLANLPIVIDGNVTCVGNGWMDRNGRVYSHVVCSYYSCPAISVAAPSEDTFPVITTGTRSVSCPIGSVLMSNKNKNYGSLMTQYPLICGPGNKWQLFGLSWESRYFENVTCIPFEPCTLDVAPPDDCDPVIQTTVPYAKGNVTLLSCEDFDRYVLHTSESIYIPTRPMICSGQRVIQLKTMQEYTNLGCQKASACGNMPDIGSVICKNDLSQCSEVLQPEPTTLACPKGSTLIYGAQTDKYFASVGNFTCSSGHHYVDTGVLYDSDKYNIYGMTCTTRADLSCPPPPMMFVQDGIFLEYPPDSLIYASSVKLSNYGDEWHLNLYAAGDGTLIYYNDNMANIALELQCGKDGLWRAPDNTLVATATMMLTACPETAPPKPIGTTAISQSNFFIWYCESAIMYQVPGDAIARSLISNTNIFCAPNGSYALPGENGYFVVPSDTLIGCSLS